MENGSGSNQNSIRPVTLITRSDPATVPRIRPKVLELMLRSGLVKYGVLVRLNASARSFSAVRPVIRMRFKRLKPRRNSIVAPDRPVFYETFNYFQLHRVVLRASRVRLSSPRALPEQ